MKKLLVPLLTLVVATLPGGYSQTVLMGRCPDVDVQQDFDIDGYMGIWYQWASYGTDIVQGKGKCVMAQYYHNKITGLIDLEKSQKSLVSGTKPSIRATLTYQDPRKTEGKFLITLSLPVVGMVTAPLWVLGTDYVSWSVAYTCLDFWFFHVSSSWILTRDRFPSDSAKDDFSAIIKKLELTTDNYSKTNQDGCEDETPVDSFVPIQQT